MRGTASVGVGAYGLVNETALASVKRLDAEVDALRGENDDLTHRVHTLILSRRARTAGAFVVGVAMGALLAVGTVLS